MPRGAEVAVDKLFWRDPYLTSCDAIVTGVDGTRVNLDRTVAFAFSGGQASDVGTIAGRQILEAHKEGSRSSIRCRSITDCRRATG